MFFRINLRENQLSSSEEYIKAGKFLAGPGRALRAQGKRAGACEIADFSRKPRPRVHLSRQNKGIYEKPLPAFIEGPFVLGKLGAC